MERTNMLLLGIGAPAARLAKALDAPLIDIDRGDIGPAIGEGTRGGVDLILFVACPDETLRSQAFESLSDAQWREGVDRPLELMLSTLHALSELYPSDPPPIVLAGPSMALSGGDGLAMLAAVAEGQRALMKSASRQMGQRGFRFTWVAIDSLLFAPELESADLPKSQDPDPLAIGGPADIGQLASLLSLLADPRAKGMIGQSLMLDGGELMLP
jgi:3-oxoacyl-[acyl-carrier protein] reductase